MNVKRWLHSKIGHPLGALVFWCSCDDCHLTWTGGTTPGEALTSLRHHFWDWHGGVDLTD